MPGVPLLGSAVELAPARRSSRTRPPEASGSDRAHGPSQQLRYLQAHPRVFERILPSVQHNIVNILRKREVEKNKDKMRQTPERLEKMQEQIRKKKQIEKIRKTKNEKIKEKLMEALRREEEARLEHTENLDNQVPEAGAIKRDEPATAEHVHEEAPAPEPIPQPVPENQEEADINDLTNDEEKKIEELHKKNKPHLRSEERRV